MMHDTARGRGRPRARFARTLPILGLVVAAAAPVAKASDGGMLAGTNTLTGSGITKTAVTLAQQATFVGPIEVEGAGRYVGFGLAQGDRFVVGYRVGLCAPAGCDPGPRRIFTTYGKGFALGGGGTVLDAGSYTLFLIADGAPVTVRFSLSGLVGAAAFAPQIPGGTLFVDSNEQRVVDAAEERLPVWGTGSDVHSAGGYGYWIASLANDALIAQVNVSWLCRYPSGTPASDPDPYAPGCPGHEPEARAETSGWCNPRGGGLVPSGSGGFITGYSVTSCGDVLPPASSVGVGYGAFIVPTRAMLVYVLGLQA